MPISEKWKQTVKKAINDSRWDEYDKIIQKEVDFYAKKFAVLRDKVDWRLLQAVLWNESGGPDNDAWKSRPLQIGNPGDPAYSVLKNASEGSDLIMSEDLGKAIRTQSIDKPNLNIQAGIAYLYTRMAKSAITSVRNLKDTKEYTYEVVSGDSLDKISGKVDTTVFELKRLNPQCSGIIRPKMKLKYVKAAMKRTITGWRTFDTKTVSERYNGGGDPYYRDKLEFILSHITPNLVRKSK